MKSSYQINIPKITLNAFEIFGDEKLEAELERQEIAIRDVWEGIYSHIADGEGRVAYWDDIPSDQSGYSGFIRYAMHKSPKKDGFIQISCMEIRGGNIIPISDTQHSSAEDFISRRVWGCSADLVKILQNPNLNNRGV